MIASTPPAPYYAVIFTSVLEEGHKEYAITTNKMIELAKKVDGFLGIESAREKIGYYCFLLERFGFHSKMENAF